MITTGRLLFLSSCLFVFGCAGDVATTETTSADETADFADGDAWTTLLGADEADLDNWEMYSQDDLEGWRFDGGELRADGAGWDARKDLVTRRDYGDFTMELEWRLDSANNSSGIFYHVPKDGVHEIYELAPEYQVIDDAGWTSPLTPDQLTAGNYAMHEPRGATPEPIGEWNTARITVEYPRVEHWLNGEKVVEYELDSEDWRNRKAAGKWADVDDYAVAKTGRIGLQNAGKVSYRNIRIREL